jgi:hypothetical protein
MSLQQPEQVCRATLKIKQIIIMRSLFFVVIFSFCSLLSAQTGFKLKVSGSCSAFGIKFV